jgi:hypothetical protein
MRNVCEDYLCRVFWYIVTNYEYFISPPIMILFVYKRQLQILFMD